MDFTIQDVPLSELEARLVQPASKSAWFASGDPEQPLLKTTIGDIRIEVARRKSTRRIATLPGIDLSSLTREELQNVGKNLNEPVARRIEAMKLLREFDNLFRPTYGFGTEIA